MQPPNSNVLRQLRGLSFSAAALLRAEFVLFFKPNICHVTVAAASIQIQLSHFLTLPTKNNSTFRVTMNLVNHIGLKNQRKNATLLKTTFSHCSNCCYFLALSVCDSNFFCKFSWEFFGPCVLPFWKRSACGIVMKYMYYGRAKRFLREVSYTTVVSVYTVYC